MKKYITNSVGYTIVALLGLAPILLLLAIYSPYPGIIYMRQTFRPSPAAQKLGVSNFFPDSSLSPGINPIENYQIRTINDAVDFTVKKIPRTTSAVMYINMKQNAAASALLHISDTGGDVSYRLLGADDFISSLLKNEDYTYIQDPETDITLFQKKTSAYSSIKEFMSNPPRSTIGLYYPPSDQLDSFIEKIHTTPLHAKKNKLANGNITLPNYIITSWQNINNDEFVEYELNWNMNALAIERQDYFAFRLRPSSEYPITIKPIIVGMQ